MDMCHCTNTSRNFNWSRFHNPTVWLSSKFIKKKIFYHTLSIQWSNFKSDYGIRWKHVVVSTYHETSITTNIQYSFKRVIYYINITKNWENDLKNTTQNLQNGHKGFVCDFWLPCFAILKLEIDKNTKIKKTLTNTQNPRKTSLINLIWSNLVVLKPTLKFDQRLNKFNRLRWIFARFDYSVLTTWPFDCHSNLQTQIFHHILPI